LHAEKRKQSESQREMEREDGILSRLTEGKEKRGERTGVGASSEFMKTQKESW
jgi:hypothetical protein